MQLELVKLGVITVFQVYLDVKDDVGIFSATSCVCMYVWIITYDIKASWFLNVNIEPTRYL